MQLEHQAENSYEDSKATNRFTRANNINGKIKFSQTIWLLNCSMSIKIIAKMRQNNVTLDRVVSADETMVWCDFAIGSVTLSLPGQMHSTWVSNNKETYHSLYLVWTNISVSVLKHYTTKPTVFITQTSTVECTLLLCRFICAAYTTEGYKADAELRYLKAKMTEFGGLEWQTVILQLRTIEYFVCFL